MKHFYIPCLIGLFAFGSVQTALADDVPEEFRPPGEHTSNLKHEDILRIQTTTKVLPSEDSRLYQVEKSSRQFTRMENPALKVSSYFHQRRIGDAIVEKDFIRYQFDTDTGELIQQTRKWRDNLPDELTINISQAEAEAKVSGQVTSSQLLIISPESEIFHFDPVPENPCWVVRTGDEDGFSVITVVDAVTGEVLGNGTPPPSEGMAIHGVHYDPPDGPGCDNSNPIWNDHAQNAHDWFETMGYDTIKIGAAYGAQVQGHVQSDDGLMFYELNHGGSTSFKNRCEDDILATEIETWINSYASMGFAFIGSCEGLCNTSENTFAAEFSKGHSSDTVVVGYCNMANDTLCENDCWGNAIAWQTELFSRMNSGYTVSSAYYYANLAYPGCADDGHNCMRTFGDTSLVFGGTTYPDAYRSRTGNVYNFTIMGIPIFPFYSFLSTTYSRAHHIRGRVTVPTGETLTAGNTSSNPYNEVAFNAGAVITANGTLSAGDGDGSFVKFVSAADKNRGIEMINGGELKVMNGGQIKIYE